MEFETQKYKLYVSTALLYHEKQKIEEIFNTYNTRLTTINNSIKVLLNDINSIKTIEDIPNEKIQLNKLIELVTNNNNHFYEICDDIKTSCNNIDIINTEIHKTVDTKSTDFNFIKSVCEDNLNNNDKNIILGDLFKSSSTEISISKDDNDVDKLKRDEYNAKRRQRRLDNKKAITNN
jgi:hypothetical protein